jgi:hypothetical protein
MAKVLDLSDSLRPTAKVHSCLNRFAGMAERHDIESFSPRNIRILIRFEWPMMSTIQSNMIDLIGEWKVLNFFHPLIHGSILFPRLSHVSVALPGDRLNLICRSMANLASPPAVRRVPQLSIDERGKLRAISKMRIRKFMQTTARKVRTARSRGDGCQHRSVQLLRFRRSMVRDP